MTVPPPEPPLNDDAVITPDTFTLSNSVCPTTFKPTPPEISAPPLASIAPPNVDTPVTFN